MITNMPPLLVVENIHAGYGAITALKNVSLEVNSAEIVTIIGANGAGKTSTLMCISGVNRIRAGKILFQGEEIQHLQPHEIVQRGLCQSPEGRKVFPRLTVLENLQMGAYTRHDKIGIQRDIDHNMQLFPILKERAKQAAGTLSGGEQQMLAVARALMGKPKLLLLDEPSLGLAPLIVKTIFQVIQQLNAEGMAILLVEQNARLALKVAHRGYVLETGYITQSNTGSALLHDPQVQAAYLGE
jgi:branched-chain amino acid transport system ATP-binding protein